MRRLPAWTPLVLAAVAIISIPLLFQVPRGPPWTDTFLEAFPFLLAGVALLTIPFTSPGPMRMLGIVVAVLVATAPVWWFFVYGLAEEEARDRETTSQFDVLIVPEDENATYELLLPLPLDLDGHVPPPLRDIPAWERRFQLVDHDGIPMLRVTGSGTIERKFFHEYGSQTEDLLHFGWSQDAAFGPSETPTRLAVMLTYGGQARYCGGEHVLAGGLNPGGASFLRLTGGFACA